MVSNEVGIQLHNRSVQGEDLTPDEQLCLESWYIEQDALEEAQLQTVDLTADVLQLKGQVKDTLSRLQSTTQHIQSITNENETLRQEIAVLQQQLSSVKYA